MAKQVTRRRHTNLKLGCANCKRKKIRCDEVLPQCENCQRARRETCSYLSLSSAEINRIRLTHSLRNSQNKLLSSNFRLPTSTNNLFENSDVIPSDRKKQALDALEFKFEFSKFSNRFPSLRYVSVQFHNAFVNTLELDYRLDSDDRSPELNTAFSDPSLVPPERGLLTNGSENRPFNESSGKRLPSSIVKRTTFSRINYEAWYNASANRTSPMCHILWGFQPRQRFSYIFFTCQRCFSGSLVLLRIKQEHQMGRPLLTNAVSSLETKCNTAVNVLRQIFPDAMRTFRANLLDDVHSLSELNRQQLYLVLANWLSACALSVLDYSIPAVFTFLVGQSIIFEEYIGYALKHNTLSDKGGGQWLHFMTENILFIHLPPYEPAFLYEMRSKLEDLSRLFDVNPAFLTDEEDIYYFEKLGHYCRLMIDFLDNQILSIVFLRNEHLVTTYPPTVVFNAAKKWWFLIPSKFVHGNPQSPAHGFLETLSSTIKIYRAAIGVGVDAVFPSARYLLSLGFEDPTFKMNDHCASSRPDPRHFHDPNLPEYLWRHMMYALRIYGFFHTRFRLYKNNVIWKGPFDFEEYSSNNRFSARHIKNALEIPVRSFNNLALRPEHYARQIHGHHESILKDPSACAVFIRPDDPDVEIHPQHEPFDLFDLRHDIQLRPNFSCQYDYVPIVEENNVKQEYSIDDLKRYFEDRKGILQGIF